MIELKPCPFCGGKKLSFSDNNDFLSVCCNKCGTEYGHSRHQEVAIAQWNIRPAEEALRTALEQEREKTKWVPYTGIKGVPKNTPLLCRFAEWPGKFHRISLQWIECDGDSGWCWIDDEDDGGEMWEGYKPSHYIVLAATPTDGEGERKS